MDVAFLNQVGICLAGIIGIGIFYYVGKNASDARRRQHDAGTGRSSPDPGETGKEAAGKRG